MFWVALATAIMMLSGEGDDTRAVAALLAGMRQAIAERVPDESRRADALRAVAAFEQAFTRHREGLAAFGVCVEAADRNYRAVRADYVACAQPVEIQRSMLPTALAGLQRDYDAALSPAERAAILVFVAGLSEAWVLDPTLAGSTPALVASRRLRGLEGVAAQRHLTLPRNVVSIVYGPLGPATFGQRYPSTIIDGGTSYARADWAGDAAVDTTERLSTRLGVRFGLFDDFEAGALFLPLELAPDLHFDPVLVFLTQQFRFDGFDLALRLSFQTPGDTGWALSPGVVLATNGRRLAFQAGAFLPMEVGTFGEPSAPLVGLNVPLRVTWNLLPSFFLTADSGVAYDDLSAPDRLTIPLGVGAGYTLLAGTRLIEFTTSFTWDHWLLPGKPDQLSALQLGAFRVALGASLSFQAL